MDNSDAWVFDYFFECGFYIIPPPGTNYKLPSGLCLLFLIVFY